MSSLLRTIVMITLLAGCASFGGNANAPRSLNNACAILDERPRFLSAFKATERKYGVPVAVQMSMIWQESKFKARAQTPRKYLFGIIPRGRQSSAYGYAQALDGTWKEYRKQARRWGARRTSIRDASDFMGWYMDRSKKRLGLSMSDTRNQYIAYHEGHTGYKRGSYRSKKWLLNIANKLQDRAIMYHAQLQKCRKI